MVTLPPSHKLSFEEETTGETQKVEIHEEISESRTVVQALSLSAVESDGIKPEPVVQEPTEEEQIFKLLKDYYDGNDHGKELDDETARHYSELIVSNSKLYDFDPVLITAMTWQESRFNTKAVSKSGARGLLQMMPSTAKWFKVTKEQLFNPDINIPTCIRFLADLRERLDGNKKLFISAYFWGETKVNKGKYTLDYYNGVMRHYERMNKLLNGELEECNNE